MFVDYLTKWPEVFPSRDQSSLTIAKAKGFLHWGATFLSKLMYEVYNLLGIKKVSTTAYPPQQMD